VAVYGAMDGPAIKGSKGGQMWQYTVQWIVQLARGAKCGSIYSTTDCPGITGSKGD